MSTSGTPKRSYGVRLVRGPFVRLPPHPDACRDEQQFLRLATRCRRPLAADLFCGAGGLSLGLEEAGFDVVLGVDHDADALETHRSLFGGLSLDWDLSQDEVVERVAGLVRRAGVTLLAGGPPCQPFSKAGRSAMREHVRAGRRAGHDERRDLWQSFLRVVALARPPAVLMENVPDMALDRDMMILRTLVDELEDLGYAVEERLVETWRYGVPQFRNRLLLVALSGGVAFEWPLETRTKPTVDNAIDDLPPVAGGWRPAGGADGWAEYSAPRTSFQRRARRDVPSADLHRVFDHITRPVREDDALAFAQLQHDTRYSQIDVELRRYRDDIFDDKYKRLNGNDLSRTITAHIAKDGYWYIHPYQDRTLTVREAARLQTFPDHVRFAGPPSSAFRQIGNAVPPLLAEQVGVAVLRSLERAERVSRTTRDVSLRLASWFAARDPLALPWLKAETRWLALTGEILLDHARRQAVRSIWPIIAQWPSPGETLEHADEMREIGSWLRRRDRVERLLLAAKWLCDQPEAMASADGLAAVPGVPRAVADLAVRVVPNETEDPVLVTNGVLRVAGRYTGTTIERVNRLSHGRMALARMIGVDPVSDGAHLALMELANSYCRPTAPVCSECPLQADCTTAGGISDQQNRLF